MTNDGKQLTEKFEIDVIDMVIGRGNCYTKDETKLDRWCLVFTSTTKEEFKKALGLMEEEVKDKLVEEVDKYSSDNQVVALYSKYTREELERNTLLIEAKEEAEREGMEKGIKEGIKEGIQSEKLETVKRLKEYTILSEKDISKITGLSIDEINKITINI